MGPIRRLLDNPDADCEYLFIEDALRSDTEGVVR